MLASFLCTFAAASVLASPLKEPTIHRYTGAGIFENAYLIETAHGVIAVDATLTESSSKGLRTKVDSIGKPLLAVLLTHGHPDHYNGVTNLIIGRSVPVLATAGVDSVVRANDAAKDQQWRPVFKDEWPARRTFPSRIVRDGESVTFDGVTFTVRALGPGESYNDSYWVLRGSPDAAFIGDLVPNGVHAYTADGHTAQWLTNIDRVRAGLRPGTELYPGHGELGGSEILDWQKNYLTAYRAAVADLARGQPALDDSAKARLVARMKQVLPTDRLEFLIGLGADPVAAELARRLP